jgi:phosphopantothenoylcysteine decarboxylase / phosphopantothenate---cysteine ligase
MKGKRILLGITGGIAAYKIASLIRLFKKKEADVKCIMTPASCDFISPLTIATLSENPVHIDFWNRQNGEWVNHVDLGLWADIYLIAPATASTISKLANGNSDNLLTATYLSSRCDVFVCPAMDLDMYAHPSTQRNISQLEVDGVYIIPAEYGELASGLNGQGRLPEPESIKEIIDDYFKTKNQLINKTVLITAGPTYEKLDPVRFIGNHSSGKMGFEIARTCLSRGSKVILITGPTQEKLIHKNLLRIDIESASEMLDATKKNWEKAEIGIFSAAVSDYRPAEKKDQKIKKNDNEINIRLLKNPDILAWAGNHKKNDQILVGFALETNNSIENGKQKLMNKNLDFIVVNTLEDKGAGFGGNTNRVKIIDKNNKISTFELKSKREVANDIINSIYA